MFFSAAGLKFGIWVETRGIHRCVFMTYKKKNTTYVTDTTPIDTSLYPFIGNHGFSRVVRSQPFLRNA